MANINGTFGDDDLFGTSFNDTINGFGGNDYLDGGLGADIMDAGDGHDRYVVDNVGDVAAEIFDDELGGVDYVQSSVTHSMGFGIEHLTLTGAAAINGTGNESDNNITGNDANNVLSGLAGKDWLKGEGGNDQLFGGNGNDALYGGDGKDLLDGGTGADYMWGGAHNDTYIVDDVGDKAEEFFIGSGGVDLVKSSVTHTLGIGIENLTLTGSAQIDGTGNESANTITGNSGNNALWGGEGNDQLIGGAGNDGLGGGAGNDNLNGGAGGDHLGGESGNDLLFGGADHDVLQPGDGNDYLDGGAGADYMDGGNGDDIYVVDNVGDQAEELSLFTTGVDLVKSSVSHTLGLRIENLTLTGSAPINGTGNEKNNAITGNSGNNVLTGLAGNDQLIANGGNDKLDGGSGKDTLIGGTGHDKFVYKSVSDSPAGTGRDVITDFKGNGSSIGDQIDLRGIDANVLKSGNQAFTWKGATPGGAGTVWYSGGVLHANIDGDAPAEFQIQLTGAPALVASDILL